MPQLSTAEKTFILIVGLTTVVGTALLRLADHHPEYFRGMRRVESSRQIRSTELRLLERPLKGEATNPLAEQIERVERARAGFPVDDGGSPKQQPDPTVPLELNHATAEELVALPGIGPTLARRIVESRENKGNFVSLEDLARVKGIGPRTVDRLRGRLVVTSD